MNIAELTEKKTLGLMPMFIMILVLGLFTAPQAFCIDSVKILHKNESTDNTPWGFCADRGNRIGFTGDATFIDKDGNENAETPYVNVKWIVKLTGGSGRLYRDGEYHGKKMEIGPCKKGSIVFYIASPEGQQVYNPGENTLELIVKNCEECDGENKVDEDGCCIDPEDQDNDEDTVRLYEVDVVATPPKVMADAESDVPIAFNIVCGDVNVTTADISDVDLSIGISGDDHQLDVTTDDIIEGNKANDEDPEGDVFTVLVPETKYDPIRVTDSTHKSTAVSYDIALSMSNPGGDPCSVSHTLELFADSVVECVEIGKEEEIYVGGQGWWDEGVSALRELNTPDERWEVGGETDLMNFTSGASRRHYSNFYMYVGLSDGYFSDTGGMGGLTLEGIQTHTRQGYHFHVYYGRKKVKGSWVVDLTKTSGRMKHIAYPDLVLTPQAVADETVDNPWELLAPDAFSIALAYAEGGPVGISFAIGDLLLDLEAVTGVPENATVYLETTQLSSPKGESKWITRGTTYPLTISGYSNIEERSTTQECPAAERTLQYDVNVGEVEAGMLSGAVTCRDTSLTSNWLWTRTYAGLFCHGAHSVKITWPNNK